MKYMLLFTSEGEFDNAAPADIEATMARVGEWWEKHSRSGAIVGGEQLQPSRAATTVHTATGSVTDGPFLESKESIGGFAIVNVPDLDAAITMAKTWPASPKVEIRPLVERAAAEVHSN